jgi:Phage Mu protein F like protein
MVAIAKDAPKPAATEAERVLADIDIDWESLIAVVQPELENEGLLGASDLFRRLGMDPESLFDEVAPLVQTYATERAAELVGMHRREDGSFVPSAEPGIAITESTRTMLQSTVSQAIAEGWTAAQIQTTIMENHGFSPARALNIARTETHTARMQGSLIAAKASTVVKKKHWELGHEGACEICEGNAEQGSIGLDENFASGDACPGAHPGCMCTLGYDLEENPA